MLPPFLRPLSEVILKCGALTHWLFYRSMNVKDSREWAEILSDDALLDDERICLSLFGRLQWGIKNKKAQNLHALLNVPLLRLLSRRCVQISLGVSMSYLLTFC